KVGGIRALSERGQPNTKKYRRDRQSSRTYLSHYQLSFSEVDSSEDHSNRPFCKHNSPDSRNALPAGVAMLAWGAGPAQDAYCTNAVTWRLDQQIQRFAGEVTSRRDNVATILIRRSKPPACRYMSAFH